MNLLLLQFNSYFNRKIKKYSSIEDYISHSSNFSYVNLEKTQNFNPNDGITTERTFNWAEKWNPDYLLVINDNNEIVSRWYVVYAVRLRAGQYKVSLKRDTIAEKLEIILKSPCFVEKGYVDDNNPLVFNKEHDFDCNQIKVGESKIHDESNCSWIVIYYDLTKQSDLVGTVSTINEEYYDTGKSDIEEWSIYANYGGSNFYKKISFKTLNIDADITGTTKENRNTYNQGNVNKTVPISIWNRFPSLNTEMEIDMGSESAFAYVDELIATNKATIESRLDSYMEESDSFEALMKYNGKIVKAGSNYYRVNIENYASNVLYDEFLSSGDLYDALAYCFKPGGTFKPKISGSLTKAFSVSGKYDKYVVNVEKITDGVETYSFNFASNSNRVQDEPYGIIAMPYKDYLGDNPQYGGATIPDDLSLKIASELAKAGMGSGKTIIDVQIMPFCPVHFPESVGGFFPETYFANNTNYYSLIKDSSNNSVSFAIHPTTCKFSKTFDISLQMIVGGTNVRESNAKLENQCSFMRLVSPNYNGQFEFNVAKNGGLDYINVDCTYKPFQPYIHINPVFNNLYGSNYRDARGLICGGDFSITSITDKFEEYRMMNKNYQQIFDRQIENMEVNYNISQKYAGIGAIEGYAGGLTTAIAGSLIMNPLMATAGVVGSVGSLANGITGSLQRKEQYNEQLGLAKDMHEYQLANIKALPNALGKVDSFNNNNKIFPILERYSCTNEEKEIFKNKLKYEGMTINALGKIEDYINLKEETFIKGRLIRLDDINENSTFSSDIYNEISKGVYL